MPLLLAVALLWRLVGAQFVDPAAVDPFVLVETATPRLSTVTGGEFATAIALDDAASYPVVTAPVPVDGAELDHGVAYGFITREDQWEFAGTISAPNTGADARFGDSLSFSGNILAVGAPRTDVNDVDQGAVYLFTFEAVNNRPSWTYAVNVTAPVPGTFDQFGFSVSTDSTTLVVGAPFADVTSPDVSAAGVVFVYSVADVLAVAVNSSAPAPQPVVLQSPRPGIAAAFGHAVAVDRDLLAVATPRQDEAPPVLTENTGAVLVFRADGADGWTYVEELNPATDRVFNRLFGISLWVWAGDDVARLLVGAPGATAGAVPDAGAAFLYLYNRTTETIVEEAVLLDPEGPQNGDEFGARVVVRGTNALVSAPGRNDDTGAAYLFRTFNGSDWFARVRLTALDGSVEDRFGQSVSMGVDRALIGTAKYSAFQGAVYQYDGPEFFPLGLPTFSPPPGTYFVEYPFEVTIAPDRPFEQVARYEVGEDNFPVTRQSPIAVNNTMFLPVETGVVHMSAISSGQRFISFPIFWSYNLFAPTPGMWWDEIELRLRKCGSPEFYCPGVVGDNDRHRVDPGFYTLPIDSSDMRTHQLPCEDDSFCIEGIRFLCDTPVCWPLPRQATAEDNPAFNETTEETEGLTSGDIITVFFNKPTNFANVSGHANVTRMFNFTNTLGVELDGRWLNDSVIRLTVVNASGADDPELTRIGAIGFTINEEGGLKMEANRTRATRFSTPFLLDGTWGKVDPPPTLVSAVAASGKQPQGGYGPGSLDTLTLTLSKIAMQVPVDTQADLDSVVEFTPPLTDVNYTGVWLSWTQFRITFFNLTERQPLPWPSRRDLRSEILDRVPDLYEYGARSWPTEPTYREQWRVGALLVNMKNGSGVVSRDRSSDQSPNNTVVVTGSWGDQPGRVNAHYSSPSSFFVNWKASRSMVGFGTPKYWVQVRKDKPFASLLPDQPSENNEPIFFNATVPRSDFIEDNDLDYQFEITDAETFTKYYIRVFAFNVDGDWGPPRVSDPEAMVPAPVQVLNVKGGRNLPLTDGLVLLEVTNVGTGQNVRTLPVSATMVNGTGGRSYLATNCEFDLDGVHVVCDAPDGVGANFQWEVTVNGHRGIISAPHDSTQSSFYPPVVAGFRTEVHDLLKTTDTAYLSSAWIAGTGDISSPISSLGGEVIHIYGRNFGRIGITWGVRAWAWPRSHPDVIITMRGCRVANDHIEMVCTTPPGAGANLEWAVSVGGQTSVRTTTAYAEPIINGVYHNVAHVEVDTGRVTRHPVPSNETIPPHYFTGKQADMESAGGSELVIVGLNLGPPRDDIVPVLAAVSEDMVGNHPDEEYNYTQAVAREYATTFNGIWPNTHPKFVTDGCYVVTLNSEIRCAAPQGFGGPLQLSVMVLGSVAAPFSSNLSYIPPTLDSLAEITITETLTVNSTTEVTTITSTLFSAEVALEQPPPLVPTTGGVNEWAVYGRNLAGAHPDNVGVLFRGRALPPRPLSHAELRVRIPPGIGTDHSLRVDVAGRLTETIITVNYAPPEVHSFGLQSVQHVDVGGVSQQLPCFGINGVNFGGDASVPGEPGFITVTMGGRECDLVANVTHTSLTCCTALWDGVIAVTVGNQTNAPVVLSGIDLDVPPVLSTMSPVAGPTNAGYVLTLTGSGFAFPVDAHIILQGQDMSYDDSNPNNGATEMRCRLLPVPAGVDPNEQMQCVLPYANGPSLRVRVWRESVLDLGTLRSETELEFTFDPPVVVLVIPTRIPDDGGVLTLVGHSFGTRGSVLLRGLTDRQQALAEIETRVPSDVNETQLVLDTVNVEDSVSGVIWAALPRCAPVLLWTHNRIECWIHPSRVPEGALELNVGWTGSAPLYPGLLFESEAAGRLPALTEEELLFAHQNAEPINLVGQVYYPGLVIEEGSGSGALRSSTASPALWAAVVVTCLLSMVVRA